MERDGRRGQEHPANAKPAPKKAVRIPVQLNVIIKPLKVALLAVLVLNACMDGSRGNRSIDPTGTAVLLTTPIPAEVSTPGQVYGDGQVSPQFTASSTAEQSIPDQPYPIPTLTGSNFTPLIFPELPGERYPTTAVITSENARQVVELGQAGSPVTWEVRLSQDGTRLVLATSGGLFVYPVQAGQEEYGEPLAHLDLYPARRGTRFTTTGNAGRIAVIDEAGQMRVVDLDGQQVYSQTLRSPVGEAVLSQDGNLLGVVDCLDCSGSYEHYYEILDLSGGSPRRVTGGKGGGIIFSPTGCCMLVKQNRTLRVLSQKDWSQVQVIKMDSDWQGYQVLFSAGGDLLAVAHDQQLDLWRLDGRSMGGQSSTPTSPGAVQAGTGASPSPAVTIHPIPLGEYTHNNLAFTPDGKQISLMDGLGVVHSWSTQNGRSLAVQDTGSQGEPYWLDEKGRAVLVRVPPVRGENPLPAGSGWLSANPGGEQPHLAVFEFSREGSLAIAADLQQEGVLVCSWTTGKIPGDSGCKKVSRAGQVFSDGQGRLLRLEKEGSGRWNVSEIYTQEGRPVFTVQVEAQELRGLAASGDGEYFAFALRQAGTNGESLLVTSRAGEEIIRLPVLGKIKLAQFSRTRDRLMVLVQDEQGALPRLPGLAVYDLQEAKLIFQRSVYSLSRLSGAALSPAGDTAAYWLEIWGRESWNGLSLVDTDTHKRREYPASSWELPGINYAQSVPMVFTPDGKLVVIGLAQQIVFIETATGRLVHAWQAHHDEITRLVISPTGGRIASAGRDGFIRIWGLDL